MLAYARVLLAAFGCAGAHIAEVQALNVLIFVVRTLTLVVPAAAAYARGAAYKGILPQKAVTING